MSNTLFVHGRQGFLDGSIDWDTDGIRVALIDHGVDTPNTTLDSLTTALSAGAFVKISDEAEAGTGFLTGLLTTKTTTSGIADAADVTLTAVSGNSVESIILFKASTSRLIAYIDTATGLPLTPNGGDVTIAWDSGASKIFML